MRPLAAALAVAALVVTGCGGDDESPAGDEGLTPPPAATGPSTSPAAAQECGSVAVPGHEAVDVRAENVACDAAREVAGAAQGGGREAYETGNFTCEPAGAPGGDTRYTCTAETGERVTFLYGTAPEL